MAVTAACTDWPASWTLNGMISDPKLSDPRSSARTALPWDAARVSCLSTVAEGDSAAQGFAEFGADGDRGGYTFCNLFPLPLGHGCNHTPRFAPPARACARRSRPVPTPRTRLDIARAWIRRQQHSLSDTAIRKRAANGVDPGPLGRRGEPVRENLVRAREFARLLMQMASLSTGAPGGCVSELRRGPLLGLPTRLRAGRRDPGRLYVGGSHPL